MQGHLPSEFRKRTTTVFLSSLQRKSRRLWQFGEKCGLGIGEDAKIFAGVNLRLDLIDRVAL